MNVTDSKPIVGMVDYGLTASLVEIGGKPFLCSPYIPFEKLTPENTVFLCMQNEQLSPLEIFRILMWVMGNAVIGGYMTNVEDTINYLKSNGITMRSGKIDITFDIKNEKHEGYTMLSYDDRYIHAGHYTSIKSMADAFYNLLYQFTGINHVRSPKCHERYHGHQTMPHGAATILQHGQQHADKGSE